MFAIVTKSRCLSLPLDILFELFDSVVLSVVLYASKIYVFSCIKELEIVQRSFYKKTLKLSKSTPSVMIYGETGTTPMVSHWGHNCIFDASRSSADASPS